MYEKGASPYAVLYNFMPFGSRTAAMEMCEGGFGEDQAKHVTVSAMV
ncbi:hypothetical protein [Mesobacillus campisalis]|nr:hypothetical protein [Mesobacillus campisalis]